MVDEEQKSEEVKVTDAEINAVEHEVKKQEASEKEAVAVKVRAEMEQEQKLKELEGEKTKLESQLAEQKEAAELAEKERGDAMTKLVDEKMAEELAKRKAVVNTDDPFHADKKSPVDDLTAEQQKQVEEESRAEFCRAHNIPV